MIVLFTLITGNYPTWKDNPQYGFTLDKPTELFITLIQSDVRLEGKLQSDINIGFLVLKAKGNTL